MSDFNPYHVLGVDVSATKKEIKAAYRLKSKDAHPDANAGISDEFLRLRKAYDVLKDEVTRAYFDSTGEVDIDIEKIKQASIGILEKNLDMITETLINNKLEPEDFNISEAMVGILDEQRSVLNGRMMSLKKRIDLARRVSAKVRRVDGGSNVYRMILAKKSSALSKEINVLYMSIAANKMAHEEARNFVDGDETFFMLEFGH